MIQAFRRAWNRTREQLQRQRVYRDLDEELRFHLDAEIAQNRARGMAPEEARRRALVSFGGMTRFREETREVRGFRSLEVLGRDARLAVRRLGRAPAFTAGVVAILAIALGATTGVGTLVHGVLLRPLPYPEAGRLVRISVHTPGLHLTTAEHSAGTFRYVAEEARAFDVVAGYSLNEGVTITDADMPERVVGAHVTTNLLGLLGVTPVVGSPFLEEDVAFDSPAVVISHTLWQRRFGGDPDIAGKTIEIGRRPRLIRGVLPPIAEGPWDRVSVYFAEEVTTSSAGLNSRYLTVIGRLAPGRALETAQRELDLLAPRLHERYPELSPGQVREAGFRMSAETLHDAMTGPVRAELRLLAVMVGALLLIAVANLVTLTLLRAERLRGEVAVARALGAPEAAIVRRFVVEGVVMSVAASALAFPLAGVALSLRMGFTRAEIPRLHDITMTPMMIAGLVVVALGIGVLLGVVSASRAAGGEAAQTLRDEERATHGRRWRRVQGALVTVQIALALALLLGAGLMGVSVLRLHRVDLGFAPAERTTFTLHLPWSGYRTWQEVTGFHTRLEEALRAMPGVTAAATAMQLPSTAQHLYVHPRLDATRRDGRPVQALVTMNVVSPAFFSVMGIPLRAGRAFDSGDIATPVPGVVLSASLARALFGEEDPLGREVRVASSRGFPPFRVVGVSGDVYGERIPDGVLRVLYIPLSPGLPEGVEMPEVPAGVSFVVRSPVPVAQLAPLFRSAASSIDPRVPLWGIRTLESIVAEVLARTRLSMLLLGVAALATLLLSVVGLYSVIAYAVTARTREFALRSALGATPSSVMRLVLREGALLAGIGVAGGIALSLASGRLLRSVLFEVSPTDPGLYLLGIAVVLAATGAAIAVPARRAGSADPVGALRGE